MGIFKRIRNRLAVATLSASAFLLTVLPSQAAEGDFTLDTTAAEQVVTEMKTKMSAFISGPIGQFVLSLVGAAFLLLVIAIIWKVCKKWGKQSVA